MNVFVRACGKILVGIILTSVVDLITGNVVKKEVEKQVNAKMEEQNEMLKNTIDKYLKE